MAGRGARPRAKQTMSAAAAVMRPSTPASSLSEPVTMDSASSPSVLPAFALRPRTIPATWGAMSLSTTAAPEPIMRPIPSDLTMPEAVSRSKSPAAVPPTMMPKLPMSAPANQNATGAKPTRNPTESIIGEL